MISFIQEAKGAYYIIIREIFFVKGVLKIKIIKKGCNSKRFIVKEIKIF